jgi:hypothetical protein
MCVCVCVCVCVCMYVLCVCSNRCGLQNQASAWPLTLFRDLVELVVMLTPFWRVKACSLLAKSEGYCIQLRRGTVTVSRSIRFALLQTAVGSLWIAAGLNVLQLKTGHEGPGGCWMFSFTLSLMCGVDRGGWSPPRPYRFTPENFLHWFIVETLCSK